jgi:regulator of protease activity HflC (stomatin/prohibitin superfamily)
MFPGELKTIFAQVVNARNEGLAALERARGESAALRNLANAAKLLENNPELRQLRFLQVLENKGGNTVVVLSPEGIEPWQGPVKKPANPK